MVDVHIDGIIFAEQARGGISRMWKNILRRLPEHDCQIHLYVPSNLVQEIALPSAISFVKYPRQFKLRPGRVFNGLSDALFKASTDRMWGSARTGVFHSTHFTTYSTLTIPQIVTVHDLFHECLPDCFESRERTAFTSRRQLSVEKATRIISDSDATLRDVKRIFGRNGSSLRTIHLAVEPEFRQLNDRHGEQICRDRLADGHRFILYVGARPAYKNFSGLLAAYALWANREHYRLVVVGSDVTCLESAQVRAYRLEGLIHFHSALSDQELVAAYNAASAAIVPSLSEGFGLPVWEAMACGTPVVAARAGSLPEVGETTPVYFEHGPPTALAGALEEAVAIPPDSERIRNGIRIATRRTWDDVARDYADVYHEVGSNSRRDSVPSGNRTQAVG